MLKEKFVPNGRNKSTRMPESLFRWKREMAFTTKMNEYVVGSNPLHAKGIHQFASIRGCIFNKAKTPLLYI